MRKQPSSAPLFITVISGVAFIAIAFSSGYKDGKLYRAAYAPATKPVVLYKPAQPVKKAKMVLYKPKSERERLQIIADIWHIKDPETAMNGLKQLKKGK